MILVTLEDVTERARGEADRAVQLQNAQATRDDARRANTAKDQFLATLSHELRTPLTALLTQAQMLRRGPMTPERTARAAEVIERSTRTQVQLIEDLLDVSRIVAGKLSLDRKPVDLAGVIRAAIEVVGSQAERKSIEIAVQVDPSLAPVDGDAMRLQQVAWNLLVNAIKFTPKGGRITVSVDQVGGSALLRVADTGSGIEPEFLPNVFDRFAQSDSTVTRLQGGLGLGLAIVRHVVELHGGSVRAESAGRGRGATFTVTLPSSAGNVSRTADDVRTQQTPPPAAARLDGVRVLLVDDDPDARESFAEILGGAGAVLVAVGSAGEARAALRRSRPDVIVSDIAMPGEDGYTFLRGVRALAPADGRAIPAIAITAVSTAADRELAGSVGFQVFLEKPVDMDRLVAAVRELSTPRDGDAAPDVRVSDAAVES
jgi:two-component system CheB/CheR fusion protein